MDFKLVSKYKIEVKVHWEVCTSLNVSFIQKTCKDMNARTFQDDLRSET